MILNESDLRRLVREMLSEMSRERKLAFRDEYGHPGMVKHALYTHWFQGLINEPTIDEFEKTSSGKSIKERVEAWKNFCIRFFEDSINYIDGNHEISCNLVNPDKSEGVGCNYSGGIDAWGYVGVLVKPRVVTMGFDDNVGVNIASLPSGQKRKRTWRPSSSVETDRETYLDRKEDTIRKNFPREDEDAYLKSVKSEAGDWFTYNKTEFVLVPESIVGLIWLGGEADLWAEDVFSSEELSSLGLTHESLNVETISREKKYFKAFCQRTGIPFYETDGKEIYDIPRTRFDL